MDMQSYRQEYFFRRCVEYAAKVYDSGSAKGDGQRYEIQPGMKVKLKVSLKEKPKERLRPSLPSPVPCSLPECPSNRFHH